MLLAYSKIWLYDELLASPLPDDPWVATALARYFPAALQERFAAYMARHPLKREIIATHVINSMINRVGSTFVHRLIETTGARAHEVVRAYLMSRDIFGLVPLWQAIEALDNQVDDDVQSRDADPHQRPARARHDVVPALAPARRRHGGDDRALQAAWSRRWRRACRSCRTPTSARASTPTWRASRRRRAARAGRARRHVRHAARDARHRRSRRRRRRSPWSWWRRSTSTSPTGSGCRGCARRSRALPGDQHWQMLARRDARRPVRPAARDHGARSSPAAATSAAPASSSRPGRTATGARSSAPRS